MTKVLITGATGYVGKHLVKKYTDEGYEVVAVARDGEKLAALKQIFPSIETASADVTDRAHISNIVFSTQPDIIIHAASLPRAVHNDEAYNTNILGTENVAFAAQALQNKTHLCFISSGSVFEQSLQTVDVSSVRDNKSAAAASKNEAEQRLLDIYSGQISIIYPPVVLDETQTKGIIPNAIYNALQGAPITNNAPADAHTNFVTGSDLGKAIFAITTKQDAALGQYLVNGYRLPTMQLLGKFGAVTQGEVKLKGMPLADESALMELMPKDFKWQPIDDIAKAIAAREMFDGIIPEPAERAKILYSRNNRALVTSYGANTTFYSGNMLEGNCWKDRLAGITLSLIQRKNGKGQPDGIGAIGGMTDPEDHEGLTDVIKITKRTLAREFKEETAGMGIDTSGFNYDVEQLVYVDLAAIDDGYILSRGKGMAMNPHCYIYKLDAPLSTLPKIQANEKEDEGKLLEISLFEALKRQGKGDLAYDYRYPHEYFATWKLAADLLGNKPELLVRLATEVQSSIFKEGDTHRINFEAIAKTMNVTWAEMDKALDLPAGSVSKMQTAMKETQLGAKTI